MSNENQVPSILKKTLQFPPCKMGVFLHIMESRNGYITQLAYEICSLPLPTNGRVSESMCKEIFAFERKQLTSSPLRKTPPNFYTVLDEFFNNIAHYCFQENVDFVIIGIKVEYAIKTLMDRHKIHSKYKAKSKIFPLEMMAKITKPDFLSTMSVLKHLLQERCPQIKMESNLLQIKGDQMLGFYQNLYAAIQEEQQHQEDAWEKKQRLDTKKSTQTETDIQSDFQTHLQETSSDWKLSVMVRRIAESPYHFQKFITCYPDFQEKIEQFYMAHKETS
jgi:hypothetical protein